MHGGQPRRRGYACGRRQPAVPLRLDGEIAGKPGTAMVGAFPGGQRSPAGERLAQREHCVVGLARADEESHRSGPLFAGEGDVDQVLSGFIALGPPPSFVENWRVSRPTDRLHDFWMAVPERRGGVARVDHLAAVGKPKPHTVPAYHAQVLGLTSGQAGRQESSAPGHDRGLPPIPHLAAGTPSRTTQIWERASSPHTWHAASVSVAISRSFVAGSSNRRSTALTSISGITRAFLPALAPGSRVPRW